MSRTLRSPRSALALLAACLLGAAGPAQAAPTVYFGLDNGAFPNPAPLSTAARDQFVAAAGAGNLTTQDYESAAVGELAALTTGVLANGVGVSITRSVSGADSRLRITQGNGAFDTFATSGRQHLEMLSDQGSTYFTATFDTPIDGLGFYLTDVSDWIGTPGPVGHVFAVLTTVDNATLEFDLTPGLDPTTLVSGNRAFFGVLESSARFTSFAIRSDAGIPGGDALGIDDFMVALAPNGVPEPGTTALAGLASLALLAGSAKRRRRA